VSPDLLIRTARRRAGVSQATLAGRAGMTQPEVARLERPGSNPTAHTLARLLGAAGHQLTLVPFDAVDESQVLERLRLTPAERLARFGASQRGLARLRGAIGYDAR
jgi:transcriptional regulator with XRE-family HTH domain